MYHRRAAQRVDGSGWHYVGGGSPIGYCAGHAPHATEGEAQACFGQWQRDHVIIDGSCSWSTCMVKGCPNPANKTARIEGEGYALAVLCAEHLTLEHAIACLRIDGPAGESWES